NVGDLPQTRTRRDRLGNALVGPHGLILTPRSGALTRMADASWSTAGPTRGSNVCDRFDLDESAAREGRDLHRRPRRRAIADVLRVHLVHAREVAQVREEDGGLDELVEAAACRLENRPEVRHDLLGLLGDARSGQLAGPEVDSELAGDEDEISDPDRLVVRRSLERAGCAVRPNDVLLGH